MNQNAPKPTAESPAWQALLQSYSQAVNMQTPSLSAGFAEAVVRQAVRQRRWRSIRRWGLGATAGLLLATVGGIYWLQTNTAIPPEEPSIAHPSLPSRPVEPSPPSVGQQLALAGEVFDQLSRKSAKVTTFPRVVRWPISAELLPAKPEVEQPNVSIPPVFEANIKPLTNGTKRVWNVFARDFGFGSSKEKS